MLGLGGDRRERRNPGLKKRISQGVAGFESSRKDLCSICLKSCPVQVLSAVERSRNVFVRNLKLNECSDWEPLRFENEAFFKVWLIIDPAWHLVCPV